MKKTKGKRGRPKGSKNKIKTGKVKFTGRKLTKEEISIVPIKRGRGRPKKIVTAVEAGADTPEPTMSVKRGRGRPPKVKTEALDKFTSADVETASDDPNAVQAAILGGKKRGRKKKEEESIFPRIEKKIENGQWITRYQAFKDIPTEFIVEPDTVAKGQRVLVAAYPDFYKIYFKKYHPSGSPGFPTGGIEVFNGNNSRSESYRFDSVAIHPKGGSIRLLETEGGDLIPSAPVPVTNRDARFARKAERRAKKMAKEAKKKIKADIREAKEEIKKLNKQKKGLKPKERKALREQIKSLKEAIKSLKADFIKAKAVAKGEAEPVVED